MPSNEIVPLVNSISEQIYLSLKSKILTGELAPGTRLLVLEIARQFQVSQAPVREALERLKQEGLITGIRNKGSVVSNITSKEIRDLFILREIIEGYAVRTTMPTLTEADYEELEAMIQRMEKAVEQNDTLRILELDMDFHGFFYKRCDNQAILELWNHMRTKVMRFMAISNRHHTTEMLADWHRRLIDALRTGDSEAAEAAFIEHMHAYKFIHLD
ncbi:GntR family transcriptional regulator [Paenibacillus barengoltzii]|uniref:GntR family transcriptional regulator n=1 Tax=Paenibacillus barengoltzii TaxID=343517 RepID=UPI000A0827C8|nr:GntR family transcriptional regulator [Paenibacillus barengoltzii]MEC2343640.1 GntR family transcriptional regulator [Paenibacillus barengoltzii]SMF13699.1 DNA-binding transcriptional regulator, GntR family [Paenibacillus barengoltzii]